MKNLKVAIVGNSVGLRVRPPCQYPNNKNYGIILEELLQNEYKDKFVFVRNLCIGRGTIWDILARRNEILNEFPNYYVINLGVSDASTREIPLWYSNIIVNRKESLKRRLLYGIYYYWIRKFRPQLVRFRGKRTWTSKRIFEKYFDKIIALLEKDTNSRIIVLSINPAGMRIEKELPGSSKSYVQFNGILENIAEKYDARFLDTTDLGDEKFIPDGIHFSLEGNRIVAERLFRIIVEEEILLRDRKHLM